MEGFLVACHEEHSISEAGIGEEPDVVKYGKSSLCFVGGNTEKRGEMLNEKTVCLNGCFLVIMGDLSLNFVIPVYSYALLNLLALTTYLNGIQIW